MHLPRRGFLRSTAAGAATLASGLTVTRVSSSKVAPSERLNLAVMGVRGRGRGLAQGFASLKESQVTHICDVDRRIIGEVAQAVESRQGSAPKVESDVRKVLDDPSVDALVIATPDHWHALATIWACQAGKHVYVEKPASHNVVEGRRMIEAARKYNKVVQLGTQSRSAPGYHDMIACLRSGRIGKVHMAKAWNSQIRSNIGRKGDESTPEGVNYDLWLGPAPERPFNPNRFHTTWHWNWDYGTGDMGNDGIHDLDIARWGLGVTSPRTVGGMSEKLFFDDDQQVPDTQFVTFTFPESEAVLVYEQRLWSPYLQEGFENGVAFYGTEGYIVAGRAGWKLILKGNKPEPTPSQKFSDTPHFTNFVDCVRSGNKRPNADIEDGHLSSTLAHLGNILARVRRPLTWDGATERIEGDEEASRLLGRTYRSPFVVPDRV